MTAQMVGVIDGENVAFAMVAVAGPNIVAKDKNSPYAFTKEQRGHHDIEVA